MVVFESVAEENDAECSDGEADEVCADATMATPQERPSVVEPMAPSSG